MSGRDVASLAGRVVAMLVAATWLGAFAVPSAAAERVALVIGNAAYEHTTPLRNPENDARDMARVLAELGFEVIEGLNLGKDAFATKVREFSRAARGAEVTLLFYAGHGLQVDGENYLVPVDAKLLEEVDLSLEAFELALFMRQMRSPTNLVFLDACRDNPLAGTLARSMGLSRSVGSTRGLSRTEGGRGTFIAYATQPGNVANDGEGRNSPFTAALLAHIATPGLSADALLAKVTDEVMKGTGEQQEPWRNSSLRKPFYFNSAPVPKTAMSAASATSGPSGGTEPAGANPSTSPASPSPVAVALADEAPAARDLLYENEFSDCPQCPRMVVVPAGIYEMGSDSGTGAHDEAHRHRVSISEPIAVGMFEVNRGEYMHFVEETNRSGGSACWQYDGVEPKEGVGPLDPGFIQGEREPMVCVSWTDAQAYVEWLSRKTRKKYRLLSESEWEYAARGGAGAAGDPDELGSVQCRRANGADEALKTRYSDWFELTASCDDGHVYTSESGRYEPNEFGLYDMLGNAREWVQDCWHRDYDGAPEDGSAWTAGGNCDLRVLRGGSWLDGPGGVRISTRDRGTTDIRFGANGFRVARTLD